MLADLSEAIANDPCSKWDDEPVVEDDFASSGDLGVSAFVRLVIKAAEVQGRGFAHGHQNEHSEPRVKAIDVILLLLGGDGSGAREHGHSTEQQVVAWMEEHREACLSDAVTKQYQMESHKV